MKILQKIVFYSVLLTSVAYFVFTLSFSTGWALGEGLLGQFYTDAQVANKLMYEWALYSVIFAALSVIFQSQIRRRFSVFNYVFALGSVYAMIQAASITKPLCLNLQAAYLQLNPLFLQLVTAVNYSKNGAAIFDLGIAFTTILWLQAIVLILFLMARFAFRLISAQANKPQLAEIRHEN
jgi:hypothetical protein